MSQQLDPTQKARLERFEKRRAELEKMTDAQLKERFWQLCDEAVKPMVELSKTHTSPSIERSVLMRMGIDSYTAHNVVAKLQEQNLLGHGAGHVVLKLAKHDNIPYVDAAKRITTNPDKLKSLF